jgi:rhamnosyltransferase
LLLTYETWNGSKGEVVSVCAIMLSCNPDMLVAEQAIERIRLQVARLIVVDNGSAQPCVDRLRTLSDLLHFELIELKVNQGVADGYNAGVTAAMAHGEDFLLLLDHDSIASADMVRQLRQAFDALSEEGARLAAVGPRFVNPRNNESSTFVSLGRFKLAATVSDPQDMAATVPAAFLISSGSLIPVSVFKEVGLFESALFVDHVDTEWCLRARIHGYHFAGANAAQMHHTIGDETVRVWFLRWRQVPVHNPNRHYFLFRNAVILMKRPYVPFQFKVSCALIILFMFAFFPILIAPRLTRLRAMMRGLCAGLAW